MGSCQRLFCNIQAYLPQLKESVLEALELPDPTIKAQFISKAPNDESMEKNKTATKEKQKSACRCIQGIAIGYWCAQQAD